MIHTLWVQNNQQLPKMKISPKLPNISALKIKLRWFHRHKIRECSIALTLDMKATSLVCEKVVLRSLSL
ncbi:hypothetical protein QT971_03785 [Microcoleus sp. herbarium19]|uniref:hypothetical protein n=1 Tax=unclassified Microcoleus TaxID=2642155 RepID=UPI002FCFED94